MDLGTHFGPLDPRSRRRVLLGIDSGQTVGKVAVFDLDGVQLAAASAPTTTLSPQPFWLERDMTTLWNQVCAAIRTALSQARARAGAELEVIGVGVCGHNDGAYPVDENLDPVRPGILATDSRAREQAGQLSSGTAGREALRLTGQVPYPASPASLYLWLREHEPRAYERVRWALFCKDWIRLQLTGDVATDPTEASASFTGVHDGLWSTAALELYGLADLAGRLPPIRGCTEVAGPVTAQAAALTGLPAGVPVITGAHDVDTAALGIGAIGIGSASIVLGTFSINQIVAGRAVMDPRWQARGWIEPQRWLHMSTSPAGAANLDWAIRRLGPLTPGGDPDPALGVQQVFEAAATRSPQQVLDAPLFVPFLYGAPHGHGAGAAWYGLRGWHGRAELLLAVLEGVAFNHRTHLDALQEVFAVQGAVRVCGGGARSPGWTQLLSDVLDLPIEVTDADEAGARGAAMLAGIGTGLYRDLADAAARCVRVVRQQQPDPVQAKVFGQRYEDYQRLVAALQTVRTSDGSAVRP